MDISFIFQKLILKIYISTYNNVSNITIFKWKSEPSIVIIIFFIFRIFIEKYYWEREKLVYSNHGPYQTNRKKIHWRQSPQKAVGDESRQEICSLYWRSKETSSLSPRYCRSSWDPSLPKIHRTVDPKITLPTFSKGNCTGLQNWSQIPKCCYWSTPGKILLPSPFCQC